VDEEESGNGTDELDLLDIEADPLGPNLTEGPSAAWEKKIRNLQVRTAEVPKAAEQRAKTREVLAALESKPAKPDERRKTEAEKWLSDNLPNRVLDHNSFLACSFADHLPV
jgi:hypothetical protein